MNLFDALTGKVSRMAHVTRYSSVAVIRRENVAEHSWWVAFISLIIGTDLNENGHGVDLEKLLTRALLHDLSECVSGDIIRTFKYSTPEIAAAIKAADEVSMQGLAAELGRVGDQIVDHWRNAKDSSLQGDIVSFADMADVVFYCRDEASTGNVGIKPVVQTMYEKWFCKFHNHPYLSQYINQLFPNGFWDDAFRPSRPLVHNE